MLESQSWLRPKDRLPTLEHAEDAITDNGGDQRRDERFHFEIVEVENFGGHHRATERRPEDRPNPGAHARRDRDASVLGIQSQPAGKERSKRGRNLRGWAFAASRSTAADSDGGGDEFHWRHLSPEAPGVMMNCLNRRVRAVPLGLGGEREDDDSRQESAERGHHRQEPGPRHRPYDRLAFADWSRWNVAGDPTQEHLGGQVDRPGEEHGPKPGNKPDERSEHEPFRQVARALEPPAFRDDNRADAQ